MSVSLLSHVNRAVVLVLLIIACWSAECKAGRIDARGSRNEEENEGWMKVKGKK